MCQIVVAAVILFLSCVSPGFAADGIIEIYSEPSGAEVYIDGISVGKTPYQNYEIPVGQHKIKVVYSVKYEPRYWEINVDEVTPQTKTFVFKGKGGGSFTGVEETQEVERYKGNVVFASIPTGAMVIIDGEKRKETPLGYKFVDVGIYDVEFHLNGKSIKGEFEVVKNETVKLIADFDKGVIVNKWKENKAAQEAREERENAARIAREKEIEEESLRREREAKTKKVNVIVSVEGSGVQGLFMSRQDLSLQLRLGSGTMFEVIDLSNNYPLKREYIGTFITEEPELTLSLNEAVFNYRWDGKKEYQKYPFDPVTLKLVNKENNLHLKFLSKKGLLNTKRWVEYSM